MLIPQAALVVGAPLGPRLGAAATAAAIDRGLQAAGMPASELCPLEGSDRAGEDLRELLAGLDFDARMHRARAVIIGARCLAPETLAGSAAFEIATRARQGGVPAYAVVRSSSLGPFEARILDLQAILLAGGRRTLEAAGRRLAALL